MGNLLGIDEQESFDNRVHDAGAYSSNNRIKQLEEQNKHLLNEANEHMTQIKELNAHLDARDLLIQSYRLVVADMSQFD